MRNLEPSAAPLAAALGLAELGIPILAAHHPTPVFGQGLAGCSCGQDCGMPARHPALGLTVADATTDPQRLTAWWRHGAGRWNLATVTGAAVDLVALADPRPAAEVAAWLRAHGVEPGPALGVGDRVQFLCRVGPGQAPASAGSGSGWLVRPGHGELVLLPPSRLVGGQQLAWRTGPDADLPDPTRLYEVLAALPPPDELATWAAQQARGGAT